MAYVPKLRHLFKILFRLRDRDAAEGLFLEGSVEFDAGNYRDARLMFSYGTRLDPDMAGNFYNLAVVTEKLEGEAASAIAAWEDYVEAAGRDSRQSEATREKVRAHIRELKERARP